MFDTNFLFVPIREKIDIFTQIKESFPGKKEMIVLQDSIMELEKLKNKGIKDAELALENLLKQKVNVVSIEGVKDVDTKILNFAIKQNAFIATNDKELRKRAKEAGVQSLVFNQGKKRITVV